MLSGAAMTRAESGFFRGSRSRWDDNTFTCALAHFTGSEMVTDNDGLEIFSGGTAVVSGNRVTDLTVVAQSVVSGNRVSNDLTVGEESTITGNRVGNDLIFSTNAGGCAVSGNRVEGDITGTESTCITMGNVVVGTVFTVATAVGPKKSEVAVLGTPFNVS